MLTSAIAVLATRRFVCAGVLCLVLFEQYVPCDVSTVCFGTAASMGAFLLGAGAPGKRRSLPNARIMIHQVSTVTVSARIIFTLTAPSGPSDLHLAVVDMFDQRYEASAAASAVTSGLELSGGRYRTHITYP